MQKELQRGKTTLLLHVASLLLQLGMVSALLPLSNFPSYSLPPAEKL